MNIEIPNLNDTVVIKCFTAHVLLFGIPLNEGGTNDKLIFSYTVLGE